MILSVSLSVDVYFFFQTKRFLLSVEVFFCCFFCLFVFFRFVIVLPSLHLCHAFCSVFPFCRSNKFCKIYKTAAVKVGIVLRVCCMMSLPYP